MHQWRYVCMYVCVLEWRRAGRAPWTATNTRCPHPNRAIMIQGPRGIGDGVNFSYFLRGHEMPHSSLTVAFASWGGCWTCSRRVKAQRLRYRPRHSFITVAVAVSWNNQQMRSLFRHLPREDAAGVCVRSAFCLLCVHDRGEGRELQTKLLVSPGAPMSRWPARSF